MIKVQLTNQRRKYPASPRRLGCGLATDPAGCVEGGGTAEYDIQYVEKKETCLQVRRGVVHEKSG